MKYISRRRHLKKGLEFYINGLQKEGQLVIGLTGGAILIKCSWLSPNLTARAAELSENVATLCTICAVGALRPITCDLPVFTQIGLGPVLRKYRKIGAGAPI